MGQNTAPDATSPLRGWRALVVGGCGEIGSAVGARLADDGADVAIADRSGDEAAALADRLISGKGKTAGHEVDITDDASVNRLAEDLVSSWGGIDALINCAGVLRTAPAEGISDTDWRTVIDINLTGAFLISRAVGRVMIENGGGRIVNLSSVRGSIGLGIGGFSAYGASKAGVNLLTKQLAAEWGRHQISVNAVASGFVRTALSENAVDDSGFQQMVAARTPLGRSAEVREIVNAIVYLATPSSQFITGQVLAVDGGLTASQ